VSWVTRLFFRANTSWGGHGEFTFYVTTESYLNFRLLSNNVPRRPGFDPRLVPVKCVAYKVALKKIFLWSRGIFLPTNISCSYFFHPSSTLHDLNKWQLSIKLFHDVWNLQVQGRRHLHCGRRSLTSGYLRKIWCEVLQYVRRCDCALAVRAQYDLRFVVLYNHGGHSTVVFGVNREESHEVPNQWFTEFKETIILRYTSPYNKLWRLRRGMGV